MKIGIIAANNLRYSPYVNFYTNILDNHDIEYDIIYPDRNNIKDVMNCTTHVMDNWEKNTNNIVNYYHFRKYAKNIIKKNKYDAIIALTTVSGILLFDLLGRNYYGKYILDIRDYTYEKYSLYFMLEKYVLKNSALNVISSNKFREFLPKNFKYVNCHNIGKFDITQQFCFEKKKVDPIIIGYVGSIAYPEQCIRLMKLVGKDERFEFHLYGNEIGDNLVSENFNSMECPRIHMHGPYVPKEKVEIISKLDILFNAYGSDGYLVKCALSNKLYDALYYKKLVLTSPGTYMNEVLGPCSFPIDLECELDLDELYYWYQNLSERMINDYEENLFKEVLDSNRNVSDVIIKSILNIQSSDTK